MTKIIKIPSIEEQHSEIILEFKERNEREKTWLLEISCISPHFQAKIYSNLDETIHESNIQYFLDDLQVIEKNKKGECQLADEWTFSLQIKSTDSLGHFVVKLAIWNQGTLLDVDAGDEMTVSFEIEALLISTLVNEFKKLLK